MKTSRRSFLASATAAAGLAPFAGFPAVVSRRSPNSVLSHACVGTGNMAFGDFSGLRSHPNIHITALCDVDANYLAKAKKICPDARVYRNAHEMMEKEGDRIDSVNVSRPTIRTRDTSSTRLRADSTSTGRSPSATTSPTAARSRTSPPRRRPSRRWARRSPHGRATARRWRS